VVRQLRALEAGPLWLPLPGRHPRPQPLPFLKPLAGA